MKIINAPKKILVVGISLKVGGIERALVEQVNSLANKGYYVDLLLFSKSGPYLREVDGRVNVLSDLKLFKYISLTQKEAKNKGFLTFIFRSFFAMIVKIYGFPFFWKFMKLFFVNYGIYDYAISYFQNGNLRSLYCGCNEFVLDKVIAKKKIAWIHSDYILGKICNDYNNLLYKRFDAVVNVSYSMKQKFDNLGIVPTEKSFVVYNRFDSKSCIKKSMEFKVNRVYSPFTIVTVGRLEKGKGIDQLFLIAKELRNRGLKFHWQFIGCGVLDKWCHEFVKEYDLWNYIQLKGQVHNPYPYIREAQLLVSGSLSETFGLSIVESQVLKTPVLAYQYEAIDELISNHYNGIVCNTFGKLQYELEMLITNEEAYSSLKKKTQLLMDYNIENDLQINNLFNSI